MHASMSAVMTTRLLDRHNIHLIKTIVGYSWTCETISDCLLDFLYRLIISSMFLTYRIADASLVCCPVCVVVHVNVSDASLVCCPVCVVVHVNVSDASLVCCSVCVVVHVNVTYNTSPAELIWQIVI